MALLPRPDPFASCISPSSSSSSSLRLSGAHGFALPQLKLPPQSPSPSPPALHTHPLPSPPLSLSLYHICTAQGISGHCPLIHHSTFLSFWPLFATIASERSSAFAQWQMGDLEVRLSPSSSAPLPLGRSPNNLLG